MGSSGSTKMRRRGAELEHAILEDAWNEMVEHGYARMTMEGVATRAGTSRSVLARRWDSKSSLAIAAIRHQKTKYPLEVADRGSLRTELLDFLDRASARAVMVPAIFSLITSEYSRDSSSSPQTLRDALSDGEKNVLAAILQRAAERGEIAPRKLAPPVESLLGDLFRCHALMTLSAPPPELREVWVDEIFLPLVQKA